MFTVVWVLIAIWLNANAISFYKEFIEMTSISWLAEYWWLEDLILILVAALYFLFQKNEKFRTNTKALAPKNFSSAIKHFFVFKKEKVITTLILIMVTFFFGCLLTLIKSSSYESALSVSFYLLSPEYTLSGIFFYDWMDTAFAMNTFFFMLLKWFSLYCVATFWLNRKTRSNL